MELKDRKVGNKNTRAVKKKNRMYKNEEPTSHRGGGDER